MMIAIGQIITVNAEEINNSNSINSSSSIQPDRSVKLLTNYESATSDESKLLQTSKNITTNIIQPAQQSISEAIKLNPHKNPLSLPTKPEEVETPTQTPITLEEAIALALKNNKEIQEGKLQVESDTAALREAKADLYPTLDLDGGFDYSNEIFLESISDDTIDDGVDELIEENPNISEDEARTIIEDEYSDYDVASAEISANVTLSYDIYDGGFRGANIRSTAKTLRSSQLNLEALTEQAVYETARDYYSLQNNDALVEIQAAAVMDADQTLKDARLLEKAGTGTKFDVFSAEVALAQAMQALTSAQEDLNIARRQLAETISIAHNSDLATADPIEVIDTWKLSLPESIVLAFKNRAELKQFLLQRDIGAEQRQIALSAARPTISASASYGIDDDFEDSYDVNDPYTVGLSLQWRLFDGGAAKAGARQAEKDIEIAETQFANQRNQIRFAVEQAYFGLASNLKNMTTATQEVDLAEESLRLSRMRFNAGVGTQTEVIDAQTDLTTARGNLLTSIVDYNQSYVDLKRQISNVDSDDSAG
ncbi:MAG: TolC family protein [Cyanobacteria bacterium P01_A01_bin.40]